MKNLFNSFLLLASICILSPVFSIAHAQGTAFSYQGRLQNNGAPANGVYDISFTLYVTNATGTPIAGPVTNTAIAVSNGLFTTSVDFGNVYDGESNWLEIAVSTNHANAFTTLAPRQQLLPVPYAMSAANLSGAISAAQLPASVVTNGASNVNFSGIFAGNGSGITNVSGVLAQVMVSSTNISAQPNTVYYLTSSLPVTVSLPASANVGDIIQVDGTGAGGWTVSSKSAPYFTWTEQPNAPTSAWGYIASSSDGTRLAAVVSGGGIYTSADGGVTWTENSAPTSLDWQSIASSADGIHLAAVATGGGIYTNNGVNWAATSAPNSASTYWASIASSSDGTHLAAVQSGNGIWTSTNSGVTWTQTSASTSVNFQLIASSADGTHLAAIDSDGAGGIYISTNSGVTWTGQTNAPFGLGSIALSSDGTHLVAGMGGGGIFTSTNGGATWSSQNNAPFAYWNAVASSSNGTRLVAADHYGSGIWTSIDSGVDWTEAGPTNESFSSIASSSDGTRLAAAVYGGGLWTAVAGLAGPPGTSAQFQYMGNGIWQPLPPVGGFLSPNGTVSLLAPNVITNGASNVTLSGTFSGDGSGLTSLNPAALSGTIPQFRLGQTNVFYPNIGNGSANFTLTTQSGYYVVIGNLVYFEAWLAWSSKGSATTGNVQLSGLPFSIASTRAAFNVGYATGITASGQLMALGTNGAYSITLESYSGSGVVNLPVSSCASSGQILITGTYRWQ